MTADTGNMATSEDVKPVPDEEDENEWREFAKFLYEYFEVAQKWEEIQKFVEVHPAISVFLIVTIGMCSVPVVIFSMFVISSIALSIFGFFLFEGTLVAIATFVLICVLFFVCMFAFGFSVFLVFGYYTMRWLGTILSGFIQRYTPFFQGSSVPTLGEKEE